jgi:TolB-like protein
MKINGHFLGVRSAVAVFAFAALQIVLLGACGSSPQRETYSVPQTSGARGFGVTLDEAIEQAAQEIESRLKAETKVAALSFNSPSGGLSEYVLEELSMYLVKSDKLSVVDRKNLDDVRTELNFNLTDEVAEKSAQEAGRILGAQYIVTGTIQSLGDVFRIRFKTIAVESAGIAASSAATVTNDTQVRALLAQAGTSNGLGTNVASGTSSAGSTAAATTASSASASRTTPAGQTKFTVYFNANGASGAAPSFQNAQNGESITIPDVGTMINPTGTFGGWNTRTDGKGTPYTAGDTLVVNANSTLYAQWIEKVYNVGDRGPAGGIIFYDKGRYSDDWRYLEAAPKNVEFKSYWPIADARSVSMTVNGLSGWHLPTQDELNRMYAVLKMSDLGDFSDNWYWSSTEYYGDRKYAQNFSDGKQAEQWGGSASLNVRVIRRF